MIISALMAWGFVLLAILLVARIYEKVYGQDQVPGCL